MNNNELIQYLCLIEWCSPLKFLYFIIYLINCHLFISLLCHATLISSLNMFSVVTCYLYAYMSLINTTNIMSWPLDWCDCVNETNVHLWASVMIVWPETFLSETISVTTNNLLSQYMKCSGKVIKTVYIEIEINIFI